MINPKFPRIQIHDLAFPWASASITRTVQSTIAMAKKRTFCPPSASLNPVAAFLLLSHHNIHFSALQSRPFLAPDNAKWCLFAEHYANLHRALAKSRTVAVRLVSMALTGYYKTFMRPRTHRPLSMLKYDPVGTYLHNSLSTHLSLGIKGLQIRWRRRGRERSLNRTKRGSYWRNTLI